MTKKIYAILFYLPLLFLALWVAQLAYQRSVGQEVRVAIQGYDPRDLLSGHYIQYQIDWEKTNCTQFANGICPKEEFCVDARWGRQCRFYVPEKSAQKLDYLFREFRFGQRNDLNFEVIYSYKQGSFAIAKQLLINNQDWREFKDSAPQNKASDK